MRPEVDRTLYRSTAALVLAFRQRLQLTQQELADRSGVARAQLARYELGKSEPSVTTLRRLLGELGWALTFGLEPATAVLDAQLAMPFDPLRLLGIEALAALELVAVAAADGVAVVAGGEAAAVLQGIPARTNDVVLHLRSDQLNRFAKIADSRRRVLMQSRDRDDVYDLYYGMGFVEVRLTEVLLSSRLVSLDFVPWMSDLTVPVADLAAMLATASSGELGPTVLALAHRKGDPAH